MNHHKNPAGSVKRTFVSKTAFICYLLTGQR